MSKAISAFSDLQLSPSEVDEVLSPVMIRKQAQAIFDLTLQGHTAFIFHADRLPSTVDYVLQVIEQNYPSQEIPFHSRWGHFRAGGVDRVKAVDELLGDEEALEKARAKLDLVITSVLLDAGAGAKWSYQDAQTGKTFARSEGLGLASLRLFLNRELSEGRKFLRVDVQGLKSLSQKTLESYFQVSPRNPLVGVEGRVQLLNNLAIAVENRQRFKDGRPGNILDYLLAQHGSSFTAPQILRAVLDGFGSIWPGRLTVGSRNLGDVWVYEKLAGRTSHGHLVPFHKLSQWMTYSLIEPILEAGIAVRGVEQLTGLAEYRNGGLMLDSGLLSLANPKDALKSWEPSSNLIVEWRALTVHLLDQIGEQVQKRLGKTPEQFPLAKVLEGGTWWAGRALAKSQRADGSPPLNILSDGTVF